MRLSLNMLSTTSYITIRERKVQQYWFDSFGKRNTHLPLSLIKMKGGLNMSPIQKAVERANNSGLGHFMHQDPISNERCTSRRRRTSRKQRRTSRVRRTSRHTTMHEQSTSNFPKTTTHEQGTSNFPKPTTHEQSTSNFPKPTDAR